VLMDTRSLLADVAGHAAEWIDGLGERPVRADVAAPQMRITEELGDEPVAVERVIADLVREAAPGLTATGSPRFLGFVIGGAHPAGLAADWLTAAWDQNAGAAAVAPAAAAFEAVAGRWLGELLGLPESASFALITGSQMGHVTALAAARHGVLAAVGHDVERDGLTGAPAIRVLACEERHVSVDRALRLLGMGSASLEPVAVDACGAMRADACAEALARGDGRPAIVVAQVGNVNTGAIDPLQAICAAAKAAGAWVHVDGAFGLWAAASPARRALVTGVELADSWVTDAHKWLNVPYDSGAVFVRDREAHRAAIALASAYVPHDPASREPIDWTPEYSRRARGFAVYATLRALGRSGVAELVDRLCSCADRFAERLPEAGFEVVAHELNQVLISLPSDAVTDATLGAIQAEGTCYPTATTWRGRRCIRVSVCNWQTTAADVDRSIVAMRAALARTAP
jgi:glutamate/tyrosine decarboxylase-like PLP-dependent enzyme